MPRAGDRASRHLVARPDRGPVQDLVTPEQTPTPDPPAGLDGEALAWWSAYWGSPLATVTSPSDVMLVRRYAVLLSEWSVSMGEFQRERVVEGSTGQPRLHPLSTWISTREAAMQGIEDRLGLSPLSRVRLGIALGEAARTIQDLNAAYRSGPDDDSDDVLDVDWDD